MFEIFRKNTGFLAMSPKPAGCDKLHAAITDWQLSGVSMIVSLIESKEADELGLAQEKDCCLALGLQFHHFPVADFGVPDNFPTYQTLVQDIGAAVQDGEGVLVHCRGGIGRSGTLAVAVLLELGFELESAIALCSEKRGTSVPETSSQRNWLEANCLPKRKT